RCRSGGRIGGGGRAGGQAPLRRPVISCRRMCARPPETSGSSGRRPGRVKCRRFRHPDHESVAAGRKGRPFAFRKSLNHHGVIYGTRLAVRSGRSKLARRNVRRSGQPGSVMRHEREGGGHVMTPRARGRIADHRTISCSRAGILLRRIGAALLSVAALALADNARAASYYFSNCASGGAGTQANPYCLDPTGSGNKTSFRYLMDGASPDVAPGDTIYLCAGACDGAGSGTYNLGVAGTANNGWTYVFAPVIS